MRSVYIVIFILLFTDSYAQTTALNNTVQLIANVSTSPVQISISWKKLAGATSYQIYRKSKTATGFGSVLSTIPATDSIYVDNMVAVDSTYEYQVIKIGSPSATGYIYASIKAGAIHERGSILLLIDTTYADSCATQINILKNDLRGDGWRVRTKIFTRTETVANIKSYIVNTYNTDSKLKAIYILGHIAVPYSGEIYPDGHTPDHVGAWPADVFYADVNGTWTDNTVNNTGATGTRNDNIPGDGKYDQSLLPSDAELQVGRVDVFNMPAFSNTEAALVRNYLNRAHTYKMDSLSVTKQALIDDNFTGYSEPFASSGWRNFAPLLGFNGTQNADYITSLHSGSYQWSYGCGAGSYTSCSGVGTTTNIAANNMNGIFTMLFGSYFGDWDNQNNFLRAPLCANVPMLASCWAGRPQWFMHHMALGENIGYSTMLAQNNAGLYQSPNNLASRSVHIALMGDPTLRTDYMKPVNNVTLTQVAMGGAKITWSASPDPAVIGYYVYRSDEEFGFYSRRSGLINVTNYADSYGTDGMKYYMVRAVKLQTTPSGAYHNMSIGVVSAAVNIDYPFAELSVNETNATVAIAAVYPNPADDVLHLRINSHEAGNARITITDITGRVIQTFETHLQQGHNQWQYSIADYGRGMYYLTIQQKQGITTLKWIKN
ncbi:hypothetical protein CAP35_09375 [Chitinophagaceae bacterium IBVUCB1]|nr:hypothetical protein CAP35_09375 [Chitinophagaceae bacterium IBVUCB1]